MVAYSVPGFSAAALFPGLGSVFANDGKGFIPDCPIVVRSHQNVDGKAKFFFTSAIARKMAASLCGTPGRFFVGDLTIVIYFYSKYFFPGAQNPV